jgi:hypothetical protein
MDMAAGLPGECSASHRSAGRRRNIKGDRNMRKDCCIHKVLKIFPLLISCILIIGSISLAHAAQMTLNLAWDANIESPAPDGYRLFSRQEGENYDYNNPVWEGPETTHTIDVSVDTNSYFVVRAFSTSGESGNTNEIVYQPGISDLDRDGLTDAAEINTFETDPKNLDTDNDGIDDGSEALYWGADWNVDYDSDGFNNLVDPDADNDGTLDGAEIEGGFDPSNPASNPDNQQPVADAGPLQLVDEQAFVDLNGSNSSDPDGEIAAYEWTQTGGTPVTLSNPAAVQPTFTAPDVGMEGDSLTFDLTVTDNGGLKSTDTCIVNVSWQNEVPLADAGSDQLVDEKALVNLNGANSTDPDDGIAIYMWTQKVGTPVTLSNSAAVQPNFTAPDVGMDGDSLTFELTVTDHGGLQATDTCIVNVSWQNEVPVADAGTDQLVDEHALVSLNGSNSSDPDDGIAAYLWTQTGGMPVTLSNPVAVRPAFTAPDVGIDGAALTFELTVTDNGGLKSKDTCMVDVNDEVVQDSDRDELPDSLENSMCTDPNDFDTDDDGIPDGMEDIDHDGLVDVDETNPCNMDSDGDGVQDGTELGYALENVGPDTDTGIFKPDLDTSSITDPLNGDTDGDDLIDGEEDTNHNGRVDAGETDPNEADLAADSVIITLAKYNSKLNKLSVAADSSLGRSATLTVTAHYGDISEVLGTLRYRQKSGDHTNTFNNVNLEPDAITVESSGGGSDYVSLPFP